MINDEKVQITNKHMDLVKAIRKMKMLLRTTVNIQHIYGHQDETISYSLLTREAQLNVQVDEQAQEALNDVCEEQKFVNQPVFQQEGYQLWVNNEKIHCNFRKELRRYIGKINLRQYLYEKKLIAWNIFTDVDWELLDKFMSKQTREFKLWFTKHVTNFCGIGKMMKRMKESKNRMMHKQ